METKAALCAAVLEVLDQNNYEDWSVWVQTYLMAQDLWDTVEPTTEPPEQGTNEAWKKKNSMALHVIHISCGSDAFSKIRKIKSARIAWITLERKYSVPKNIVSVIDNESNDYREYEDLSKALQSGDLYAAMQLFMLRPNAMNEKITVLGQTALHIAVAAKHLHIVEELIELMKEEALEIKDDQGNTALFEALFIGNYRMAECMIRKNKKLVHIRNELNILPVVMAIQFGYIELATYLYYLTPLDDLAPKKGVNGATLCTQAIYTGRLDIALGLIEKYPRLALSLDKDKCSPLYALSAMPYAFPSGDRLIFWKRWIYSLLALLRQLVSNLLNFSGIEHSYEMEGIHDHWHKLLLLMGKEISMSNMQQRKEGCVDKAIGCAIKNGNFEFLFNVVKANSDLLRSSDRESRNIFFLAVLHRQPKIFSLIYGLKEKNAMTYGSDVYDNFILHMAGMSAASTPLNRISVPALQMQRELQWFKEVESIVHPKVKEALNKDGLTPRELFTKNHKDMMQAGEQWMKGTATSCTTIAALIVTIMFATAFTVPGGNDQYTGFPVFLHKKLFMVFIISDALSLFSSSTSVLVFLGILTSRYAEEDFLKSLPTKMTIGLSTLFFSIATMMIAFSAGLLIMLHGRSWLVNPVICLAGVPITLFILMQFGLLVDLFKSTFKPGIFDRKMKSWV